MHKCDDLNDNRDLIHSFPNKQFQVFPFTQNRDQQSNLKQNKQTVIFFPICKITVQDLAIKPLFTYKINYIMI